MLWIFNGESLFCRDKFDEEREEIFMAQIWRDFTFFGVILEPNRGTSTIFGFL
jgi:hypothetical protein